MWENAIAIARKAGTVSLFGGCPADTSITLDTNRIHYDEISLKGTFHHTPQTIRKALQLISEGDIPAHEFIQKHAPLAELPSILHQFLQGSPIIKCAIIPPNVSETSWS